MASDKKVSKVQAAIDKREAAKNPRKQPKAEAPKST